MLYWINIVNQSQIFALWSRTCTESRLFQEKVQQSWTKDSTCCAKDIWEGNMACHVAQFQVEWSRDVLKQKLNESEEWIWVIRT